MRHAFGTPSWCSPHHHTPSRRETGLRSRPFCRGSVARHLEGGDSQGESPGVEVSEARHKLQMPRSVAQETSDGWGRNIKRTLQRRESRPPRAPGSECSAPRWGVRVPSPHEGTKASVVVEEAGHVHTTNPPAQGWRQHPKGEWSKWGRSSACEADAITVTGKCVGGRKIGAWGCSSEDGGDNKPPERRAPGSRGDEEQHGQHAEAGAP